MRPASQWETSLYCNDVSHCLGPYLDLSLHYSSTLRWHMLLTSFIMENRDRMTDSYDSRWIGAWATFINMG